MKATVTDYGRLSLVMRRGRTSAAVQVVCDNRGHPWLWEAVRLARTRTKDAGRCATFGEAYSAATAAAERLLAGNGRSP